MNPLKIYMTFLLLLGTTGCATYLYSAYVPVAAYDIAAGLNTDSIEPGLSNSDIVLAAVDTDTVKSPGKGTLNTTGRTAYADAGLPENSGDGQIFADMRTATGYFRDLLKAEKVDNPDDYVLTRLDKGDGSEFILIAAVYRPRQLIEVADAKFPGTLNVISDKSPAFYAPFRTDIDGRALDKVVAWSLVPVDCFKGAEQQKTVLADTAGAVLAKTTAGEFWAASELWANGDVGALMLAGNLLSCPARESV